MKLASLKHGRDGRLAVVTHDLTRAVEAPHIALTMQQALDNWHEVAPMLSALSDMLHAGTAKDAFDFDPKQCVSPLPRAYHWADGSAYVTHVELVRKARGAEMPPSFWTDPLIYQGGSDCFLAPHQDITLAEEAWGIDFEAEIAVITDDVPMGVSPEKAADHIKLVMLVNDVSLRNLIPGELAKGFGFYQSKPSSSFSPVTVTPDELGPAWKDGRVHLPLVSMLNGKEFGRPNAAIDMVFNFPMLIAHAARTRPLCAGSIIGSGTVANKNYDQVGSSCIAEKRMAETITGGSAKTPFMKFGDRIRIEMFDDNKQSIFGAIDQKVVKYG